MSSSSTSEPVVNSSVADSTPWWPAPTERTDRPNVVVILLDDVGFSQLGCYGSSISTPHMDALAGRGLRYTNFHATALCSPTRASLLTGRNHHAVGMGFLAAFDTGFPNYRGRVDPAAANLAEVLGGEGYGTLAVGKWHLTPSTEMTPAGPFDNWPTRRGFDRYYGFLGGEEDQWAPELWQDQHLDEEPGDGVHLTERLVTRANQFVADHVTSRPADPFFLYVAFGACHAPHQAPDSFIDAYRGAFDHGWDVERERVLDRQLADGVVPPGTALPPRNPGVAAWEDLDAERQRLYARMQEVYAGFLTHTDAQVGRLLEHLGELDLADDTLVVLLSDNGASGEGGEHGTANEYRWFLQLPDPVEDSIAQADELGSPTTHGHYPAGWAQAGNTPLRFYKRHAYAGGVRVPLILSWPRGIREAGESRGQFHHVVDLVPTILEACSAAMPASHHGIEQMPLHGESMADTFDHADADTTRGAQYFETAGNRGIVADGWKAIARHRPGDDFAHDQWELYRITEDVGESHDVAVRHPDVLAGLVERWWEQARTYGVLPLDDRMQERAHGQDPGRDRLHYEMFPRTRLLNGMVGPSFADRGFVVRGLVESWAPGHSGTLLAWGRRATGMILFVADDRLHFHLNLGGDRHDLASDDEIVEGATSLAVRLAPAGESATATLLVDDQPVGTGALPRLIPSGMGLLPTQCGYNFPSGIVDDHPPPFAWSGNLRRVVIDLDGRDGIASDPDWHAAIAQQ